MKIGRSKQFCIHNHDTFIVGRSYGRCNECIRQQYVPVLIDKRKIGGSSKFCPRGHDKDIVGRYKNGQCAKCKKECSLRRYFENIETISIKRKQYQQEHKAESNAAKTLRLQDPSKRLAARIRGRLHKALKGQVKPGSAIEALGCSIDFLKEYIALKFLRGMTWDNWGKGSDKWNLDHIIPLASFDLTDIEQFKKACHYTNLQPLWAPDNIRKRDKILV